MKRTWFDETEMKLARIAIKILVVVALVFFGLGIWRLFSPQRSFLLAGYGLITAVLILLNVYRINKVIKINGNNSLTFSQAKILSMHLCRATFGTLGSYFIFVKQYMDAVILIVMLLLTVLGEALIKYVDSKKLIK